MKPRFQPCSYQDVEKMVIAHNAGLRSPIDSFCEEHILDARSWAIVTGEGMIGYCSIYHGKTLTQFFLKETHRHLGQDLFAEAKKLETVQQALVPTCDEVFLSLCLDNSSAVAKQAYFFQVGRDVPIETFIAVTYRPATLEDLPLIQQHASDFFDDALEKQLRAGEIFIGFEHETPIAFGVFERGRILKDHVSIGMYTVPDYRGKRIGKATLRHLIGVAQDAGITPIAGCWYYNHLSKRTLEGAGMFTSTRYLRIAF